MKKRSVNSIKSNREKRGCLSVLDQDKILMMLNIHFGHVDFSKDMRELKCENCRDYLNELCGGEDLVGDEVIIECMKPGALANDEDWGVI
jgi:hypothetical protein